MAADLEPEIILYDLACIKNVCFSPAVWRIRMMLNYKKIPYKTIFLDFQEIEPTIKKLDLVSSEPVSSGGKTMYTVPVIHHIPANKHIMDSSSIAKFLEETYPSPPLPLTSPHGSEIELKARKAIGPVFKFSLMPREIHILSPSAQSYFRRTREATLGHPLENLLDSEEEAWEAAASDITAVGQLMLSNKAEGPFVLGAKPSYTDFTIAGSLQTARVVDEGIFQRIIGFAGFGEIYEACLPWMERKD